MASPNIQDWFYVELTLKKIEDGTTATYKLSNRPILDDDTHYFPLLINIRGVGSRMSDYIPYSTSGQISIDISEGSFGFERKFSDLFERFTLVNQPVKIFAAQSEFDDLNVSADFSLAYTATALEWSIADNAKVLNISIAGSQIKPRIITKIIDSASFPNAPGASIGKALPVVFGAGQEVAAIRIDADGDASPAYAYATTLGATFPTGGVQTYYAKDADGVFRAIASPATTSTGVYAHATSNTAGLIASDKYAYQLNSEASGYIVKGGRVSLQGGNNSGASGTTEGNLTIELCEADPATGAPNDARILASTSIDKNQYQSDYQQNSTWQFWVEFSFDRFVVTQSSKTYYILLSGSNEASLVSATNPSTENASGLKRWYKQSGSNGEFTWLASPERKLRCELYGVVLTDSPSSSANADGFGHASFEATQKAAVTGQVNPDITRIDFVVSINGIKDDGSGTLTGGAGTLLSQPKHVVALLEREWDGTAWVAGAFDFGPHSGTHNSNVTVRGATTGRTTYEQALIDICRNTGSRIAAHNGASKQLCFYQWGSTQAPVAVVTDEDAQIGPIEERGISTVVNRISFYYDRRARGVDLTIGSAQGDFKNYAAAIDWYYSSSPLSRHLSNISFSLYGERPAAAAAYDYFASSASAQWVAQWLLARNGAPARYVELEVPFFEYRGLELLDIIEILHPALPGFFGTSAKARHATLAGEDVDLTLGEHWKRATRYRAQIESKEMILVPGGLSKLKLGCRLLVNFPKDPT